MAIDSNAPSPAKKILLIEDNEADQFLFVETAKKVAPTAEVICANNGSEAITILEQTATYPDLIFLDIEMPGMNGHEFLEEYGEKIKEHNTPLFILTSSNDDRDRILFSPYGCVRGYYVKSANPNEISNVLLNSM